MPAPRPTKEIGSPLDARLSGQHADDEHAVKERDHIDNEDDKASQRPDYARQLSATEASEQGSTNTSFDNGRREAAMLGQAATLQDIELLLHGFFNDRRTKNRNAEPDGVNAQSDNPIADFNKLTSRKRRGYDGHGDHPGLGGVRRPNMAEGGTMRGGGPGAVKAIPQVSRIASTRSETAPQAGGTQRMEEADEKEQANCRAGNVGQQQPSFSGPSRFPGGQVINSQPSMRSSDTDALDQVESQSQAGDKEDQQDDVDKHDRGAFTSSWRIQWRVREFMAELVASTFLLVIGASVNCQVHLSQGFNSDAGSYPSQNWAWGFAVLGTVHLAGGISGAHCNPAITITLALLRRFPASLVPVYIAAQVLGCFCGAGLAYAIYRPAIDAYEGGAGIRTVIGAKETASLFVTIPDTYTTPFTAFLNEVVASAVLGMVVFAIGDDSNSPPGDGMSGLILGLSVTMVGMALGWQTGYAINAARDFGPRVLLACVGYGRSLWTHNSIWWLYGPIVGTTAGTLIGCVLYDVCIYCDDDSRVKAFLQRSANSITSFVHTKERQQQQQ